MNPLRRILGMMILEIALLAGFGAGSASASSPKGTITSNWQRFFAVRTPVANKVGLLQNGAVFKAVIDAQSSSSLARSTEVRVSSVSLTTKTSAAVRYTISLVGRPTLKNQTGHAIYQSGTWKVSDASFCALLALQGTKPAACSSMNHSTTVKLASRGRYGSILVTGSGQTLYTYSKDSLDHSNCIGSCATLWPPLVLPSGVAKPTAGKGVSRLGTLRRPNGRLQVTYQGRPLYRYVSDSSSGQVNGNGVSGFTVVKVGSSSSSTRTPTLGSY